MSLLTSLFTAHTRMSKLGLMPKFGFANQDVHYFVELGKSGRIVAAPQAFNHDQKGRIVPRNTAVPYFGGRSGQKAPPYFLWDNTAYVFGVTKKEDYDAERRFGDFRELHLSALNETDDPGLVAVRRFLEGWSPENYEQLGYPDEAKDRNIVFRLSGERLLVHETEAAADIWARLYRPDTIGDGVCLVTGAKIPIARIHPPIKSFENPARLVSFDKDNDAFSSYGHLLAENAPTGIAVAFAYTAVLNHFLARDSGHRIQIGDASTVFWADASGQEAEAEGLFFAMFGGDDAGGAQDDDATKKVRIQLERIQQLEPLAQIAPQLKKGVRFHVLGLAPNAARLSVRLYWEDDFGSLVEHYAAYVQDVALEPTTARPVFSIRAAVLRTAPAKVEANGRVAYDKDHISSLLSGELLRAVLTGGRFPRALLGLLVLRVRSDHVLDRIRISLIKGLIVRDMRLEDRLPKRPDGSIMKDYLMRSDPDDPNIARRLGRLFALIERAQQAALGERINATVKDRFLGSAAATPARVFPMLLRNAENHHLKRLRNGHSDADWIRDAEHARRVAAYIGKDIGLLWGGLGEPVPKQQSSEEQGMFLIGYYQERYTRRKVDETADESDTTENDSEE